MVVSRVLVLIVRSKSKPPRHLLPKLRPERHCPVLGRARMRRSRGDALLTQRIKMWICECLRKARAQLSRRSLKPHCTLGDAFLSLFEF